MHSQTESELDRTILEVKHLLLRIANLPAANPDAIDAKGQLVGSELGIDSIDLLELIVELDKTYGLKIKNNEEGRKVLRNVHSIAENILLLK